MTKIEYLINEINLLQADELEILLEAINKKVDKERRIKSILNEYKGIGKGVWGMDAQEHINNVRDKDRI